MTTVKTITAKELKAKLDRGDDVKIVETLPEEAFKKEHIPGAINIPPADIEKKAPELLSKEDEIVVYCANTECQASPEAARKLTEMGYTKILDFEEGKEGWKAAGYKTAA